MSQSQKLVIRLCIASLIVFLSSGTSFSADPVPDFSYISKEVNSGKNDAYYRVLLNTKEKAPAGSAIAKLCKHIDNEGRRKLTIFVYLPGMNHSSYAYATCGRTPDAAMEVKVLGK